METTKNAQPLSLKNKSKPTRGFPAVYKFVPPSRPEPEPSRGQFWSAVGRRIWLMMGVTTAVTVTVLAWSLMQVKEYEGKFELLIASSKEPGIGLVGLEQKLTENFNRETAGLDDETQLQVLKSPKVMESALANIQAKYPEVTYESLFTQKPDQSLFAADQGLVIERINKTKIIQVRYRDTNPEKIQFILEKIAGNYIKYSQENTKNQNLSLLNFIQNQLTKLQSQGKEIQQKIQRLRQQYNIIDPTLQGQKLAEQIIAVKQQEIDTTTSLAQMRSLYTMLEKQLGLNLDEAIAASALSQNPLYQQLLNRLQQIEINIAIEKTRFTEATPKFNPSENNNKMCWHF